MRQFKPGKQSFQGYGSDLDLHADVVIVGAGAGGSAAAAALAAGGLDVVVLEQGRHWKPSEFKQDTAWAFRNLYANNGMRTLRGNAVMPLPGGRGVGGSTLINSAICFRTPPEVMQRWRTVDGCEHITADRFGAYFDRIWDTIGVTVQPVEVQRNNNLVFRDGAHKLGLEGAFLSRSAPGCVGCGICQFGCPTGGKASVDRTFLAEAIQAGTVGVYADCRMRGVQTKGDRVVAVTGELIDPVTQQPAGTVRATADTFVLSGGPIGSPLFLSQNGLSDSTHLGQHLVVHPTSGMLARFPWDIVPWQGVTQGYYVDMWKQGYLLQTYTVTPDQYYLCATMGMGPEVMEVMADLRRMASAGALVHDEDSEGFVRMLPSGLDLYYHLGEGDKRRLLAGMQKVAEVFFAAGATSVFSGLKGTAPVRPGDDLAKVWHPDTPASRINGYASHPMGTCRMGGDPSASVIDPDGRVWGWKNLHVADASTFPSSLGVNPQVTTMAMGLMVGEGIAGTRV